jgi:hypothetical protein
MRKEGLLGIFVFACFVFALTLSSVSAAPYSNFREISQGMIDFYVDIGEPILTALFGGGTWSGIYLFEKLLIFIIVLALVYLILGKFPLFEDQKGIRWIVAIIVPLLGVRYMDVSWVESIIGQYTFLAVIFTAIIPFLLYFFFIYNIAGDHGIIRKLGWLIFVGIYFGLWSGVSDSRAGIYFWTFVAALVCLLGDNLIQKRYEAIGRYKNDRALLNNDLTEMNNQIRKLEESIRLGTAADPKLTRYQINELRKHYKWTSKRF